MRVLLVEPDKLLGSVARDSIAATGQEVVWTKTGQQALDALEEYYADVIVLEINLGVHNGVEFLYELRSYDEWRNIPVIVYTSNHRVGDSVFAAPLNQLGVAVTLNKSEVSIDKLMQILPTIGHQK